MQRRRGTDDKSAELSVYIRAAAVTAGSALWLREGRTSFMLPALVAALIVSCVTRFRVEKPSIRMLFRFVVFVATVVLYKAHPPQNQNTFIDSLAFDQCGELCLAEIVIRSWSRTSSGTVIAGALPRNNAFTVMLVSAVFLTATNTYDEHIGRYFTPPFMLFLFLAIQSMRADASPKSRGRARFGVSAALISAGLIGAFLFYTLTVNRDTLTNWANNLINGTHFSMITTGLSEESHLSSMFGQSGSYERVLRIRGNADTSYMRAMAMYSYDRGMWGPPPQRGNRQFIDIDASMLRTGRPGDKAEVTRYMNMRGIILAPLNTTSLDIEAAAPLQWARMEGGPLRAKEPVSDTYTLSVGANEQQGMFCVPPNQEHLLQLLQVPGSINPAIHILAKQITNGITDPERKAHAIEAYLPANHSYSLRIQVNNRDPLGDFLFSNKSAHCEFFASAAVMLMRCANIPSRYVIGYYAHEQEDDATIVRQRDAHAWAECWIEGKGWITIDATPGSGRPDGGVQSIPLWKRTFESIQDWFNNVKQKFTVVNLMRGIAIMICLALTAFLIQNRYHFQWRRIKTIAAKEYTVNSVDLKRISARFEAACRKSGLACPPDIPWQEFLAHPGDAPNLPTSTLLRSAAQFVAAYNQARFGSNLTSEDIANLGLHLDKLEQETSRGTTGKAQT